MLTGIKAVTFDVDGTLWDFETVMRRSLGKALEELGRLEPRAASMLSVDRIVETRDRVHEELRGAVADLNQIRLESFRQVLRETGSPDDSVAWRLCKLYFEHRDTGRRPFPDARPALQALHGTYTLGVLSNGNTPPAALGLDGLFNFVVLAQEHGGAEKPDPRLFQIALEQAGCSPQELVHVGDSAENDVAGARAVGVRSVWLNRNGGQSGSDVKPDAEIASLRELAEVLY